MNQILLVALGGAIGAVARYSLGHLISSRWPMWFPLGTFIINITGSFIIGFFMELASQRVTMHPGWRMLIVAGFTGAYTTFSTFEYETLQLIERGQSQIALLYIAASVMVGFAAVWCGVHTMRLFSS